ncbi:MAG: hypothetical protein GWP91_17280 [Rhodobacterales bacterium]|nr:hypothetical protein [Rhodobacterales bacterium]
MLASSVRRAATRAQQQLDKLTAALVDIRSPAPRAQHSEVTAATERLRDAATTLEASANTLAADNPVVEFATLEAAIKEALLDVDFVNRRTHLARQAAQGELAALKAQEARQTALKSAVTSAIQAAQICRTFADTAQAECAEQAMELRSTGLPKVLELLAAAEEIVDIALFQAGEAEASAKWAADEDNLDDAMAHASTAESFAERIRQDLPEATEALNEAQELAHVQLAELNARRSAAASAHQKGLAAHQVMTEAFAACGAVANRPDAGIVRACALLSELKPLAHEQHQQLQAVNERVQHSTDVKEAQSGVDSALHLAHSLLALKSQADDRLDALRRAINTADAQANALLAAIERANQWQSQATESSETLHEQHLRLAQNIIDHNATSDEVETHRFTLTTIQEEAKGHAAEVLIAARGVQEAPTPEAADAHLASLRSALESLDHCRDRAVDSANAGIAAAEREAQERREDDIRARGEASQRAAEHLVQLTALVERSVCAREDAADALQAATSPTAQVAKQHADRHHERLLAAVQAALSSADEAANAPDAGSAEEANLRAARAAELGISAAKAAEEALHKVLDHHRFAAEAAQALTGMQSEAASLTKVAAELVGQAREEARFILKLDVDIHRRKALAGDAGEQVKTAERAAAKLAATTAMMADESDPDEAQGLLQICRATVQRIEKKVEFIRGLVNRAREQAVAEAAEAAKALTDARASADEPLKQSIRAAAQAASLLESAQRDLPSSPDSSVVDAYEELKAAVVRSTACAEDARIERTENQNIDDLEALRVRKTKLGSIATESDALLADVIQAVDALTAATQASVQLRIALTATHASEQILVRQIRDAALQTKAVSDELGAWFSAVAQPGAPAQAAIKEVILHAMSAEKAAQDSATLTKAIAQSKSESSARAVALTNHLNQVIEHLGKVVSFEQGCRKAVVDEEQRRAKAQEELEAKRREEAAQKLAKEAHAQQMQAKDASKDRSNRLGARRRRFLERRGRSPEGPPSEPIVAPDVDTPRARKWVRQNKGAATDAPAKAKGRPRPARGSGASAPEPKSNRAESTTGADALLQRLRDRAKKD